ncbi:MAG: segregation/condensation protein A [Candidatus Aenigmarchaeota archaeon]|nr:segregation/condensation protein A [Candidatus Aenigmarchaeota archaeon]
MGEDIVEKDDPESQKEDFEAAPEKDETQNILKTILEKESWEDVIYYIVSVENIDPWNVDLVKLTTSFLNFVRKAKDLDFRIPAKIVFVSAILLKLKSENLSIFGEEEESAVDKLLREGKPLEELGIDPNMTSLGHPMKRIPKRQVTLEELMGALKAATKVRDRRDVRRRLWKERAAVNIQSGEDIERRIERIMGSIEQMLSVAQTGKVEFKDIVKDWNREKIVDHLLPVLHLEQEQKIETEQADFFHDIFVRKKQPLALKA